MTWLPRNTELLRARTAAVLGEQEAVRSRARTEELRRRNRELAGSDGQDQRELREMIEIFQNQSLQVMELKALLVRYVMKVNSVQRAVCRNRSS